MRKLHGIGECHLNSIIVAEIIKHIQGWKHAPSPNKFHKGNIDEAIEALLEYLKLGGNRRRSARFRK